MIRLIIHLEQTGPTGTLMWWSESPDVPGFSATDQELQGLILRSRLAIEDARPDLGAVDFTYELAIGDELGSPDVVPTFDGEAAGGDTANPSARSATARLLPASA